MTERLDFHFSLSCIGEGNGNPLQCSCLENPRDWGAWWAAVYGVTQSRTQLKQLSSSNTHKGLPRWLSGKEFTCQCKGCGFYRWDRKILLRRKWQCTPIFLPGKSHGQRILAGYSPWGHKRLGYDLMTKTTAAIYGKQANLAYSLIDFYTCAHMYRA